MHNKTLLFLLILAALVIGGCARHGLLIEGGPKEAQLYADKQKSLYTGAVEKFEEGKLIVPLATGETLEGSYTGYRPEHGRHCTKSWFENLRADSITVVVPVYERGYVKLTGQSGEGMHCFYGWTFPECAREAVCKSTNEKYYRLEF
jgi:hypothetical protein